MQNKLAIAAQKLGEKLRAEKIKLAAAESCTGGWIAQVITAVPSASEWFDRGFVTYTEKSKQEMLGVKEKTIKEFDAVSKEVAHEMAEGALKRSEAQVSISVTGNAGPTTGTSNKSVGLVWFGFAREGFATETVKQHFGGDREAIRKQAVEFALTYLYEILISLPRHPT